MNVFRVGLEKWKSPERAPQKREAGVENRHAERDDRDEEHGSDGALLRTGE